MYYVFCVCGGLFLFISTFFSVPSLVLQFPFSFLSNLFFPVNPITICIMGKINGTVVSVRDKGSRNVGKKVSTKTLKSSV